jgi:protein ATS1
MAHVVVVLTNGEVWGWGKGRKGQLGEPAENVWRPRRIEDIGFFAVDVVCGKDFTCIFGSPSTGDISILGPNSNDRFGMKTNAPATVLGWKQVAASWGSIFVLSESGSVTAWGRNDHGQLPPAGLPPLKSIIAGSEHCLGLTEAAKVLAWGWGEHGNCGEPTDEKGDVKDGWNEIVLVQPASAIFAGCATSFVVAG